jgi:hypothetical protein
MGSKGGRGIIEDGEDFQAGTIPAGGDNEVKGDAHRVGELGIALSRIPGGWYGRPDFTHEGFGDFTRMAGTAGWNQPLISEGVSRCFPGSAGWSGIIAEGIPPGLFNAGL